MKHPKWIAFSAFALGAGLAMARISSQSADFWTAGAPVIAATFAVCLMIGALVSLLIAVILE